MEKDGLQCLLSFRGILNILVADTGEKGGERETERENMCVQEEVLMLQLISTTRQSTARGKICKYFTLAYFSALMPRADFHQIAARSHSQLKEMRKTSGNKTNHF